MPPVPRFGGRRCMSIAIASRNPESPGYSAPRPNQQIGNLVVLVAQKRAGARTCLANREGASGQGDTNPSLCMLSSPNDFFGGRIAVSRALICRRIARFWVRCILSSSSQSPQASCPENPTSAAHCVRRRDCRGTDMDDAMKAKITDATGAHGMRKTRLRTAVKPREWSVPGRISLGMKNESLGRNRRLFQCLSPMSGMRKRCNGCTAISTKPPGRWLRRLPRGRQNPRGARWTTGPSAISGLTWFQPCQPGCFGIISGPDPRHPVAGAEG